MWCHPWILLAIAILVHSPSISSEDNLQDTNGPTVETKCGKMEGKLLNTPKGQCHAYLGVPFAVPPIGDLRWKKPEPAVCWTGVKNATSSGPQCIQFGSNGTDPVGESEDCLYLNIIVPKATIPSEKLPSMVFIHGGGFMLGSASEYGQEGPCETLAIRGVIVVLIQYRLFMHGFFSTGDDTAPGNYGLWDQVEALRWISKNIDSFGGDPNRVTIFGESAGGASVSYLTYTPVAQDLFKQSIAQSGSAFSPWASARDSSIESVKKLASAANCTDSHSKDFVSCLRKLSTIELQRMYNRNFDFTSTDFPDKWSVRIDGELFTQANFKELETRKPVLIGVNSLEEPLPNSKNLPSAQSLFNQSLDQTFNGSDKMKNQVLKYIARYVYIDSKGDSKDEVFVEQQHALLQANTGYHVPAAMEAVSKSANGQPVWVYNFDFWSNNTFEPDYPFHKGAPHAHELCYLFLLNPPPETADFFGCPSEYTGKYRQMIDYLGEMWTNFAIKGDPSPNQLVWARFTTVSNASTMVIRENLSIESQFYLEAASFWNLLVPSIKG